MSLRLMYCQPDPGALAIWATRYGLLSPDGDYGYALHALLVAAFGSLAPKPFRYLGETRGLLAYTGSDAQELRDNAGLATPDVARALGLDSLDTRSFPSTWRLGQQLGFELRLRPVIRTADGRERDRYLHAIESKSAGATAPAPALHRETVYSDWLRDRFSGGGGAEVQHMGMQAFRLTRVIRRGPSAAGGQRKQRTISGPDVIFKGRLRVTDGEPFARLVARGVGRHRAFGFGMLLLRPASSC